MKILLVHQNFPGQFKHLVPALLANPKNQVVAFTMNSHPPVKGLRIIQYSASKGTAKDIHPWVAETETKVIRGDAAFRAALTLKKEGFEPDIIFAHPGWGESLFLKEIWPKSKLIIYCEFYYATEGTDVGFDPEFATQDPGDRCRVRMKNINNLMHFDIADVGIAPTQWQKNTFPEPFRSKIKVIHDGIDTQNIRPNDNAWLQVGAYRFTKKDEIITFVNRNLEPYRGYHIFMRALPDLLQQRPNAQILIVGGDGVSYGAKSPDNKTWKQIFLDEVKDSLDLNRVHFLGNISYPNFLALLQISTVHVYLTYPFVLSWSLLEAMACSCAIVASNTAPLHEVIIDKKTGLLVDFFSPPELTSKIVNLLENPELRQRLGEEARKFVVENYDLNSVTLPKLDCLIQKTFKNSFSD